MKVKNINNTEDNRCSCSSWLEHWKKFSSQKFDACAVIHCKAISSDIVGAHVQKDILFDNKWYIVPLCKDHNNKRGESLLVYDNIVLVSANASETCEKRIARY